MPSWRSLKLSAKQVMRLNCGMIIYYEKGEKGFVIINQRMQRNVAGLLPGEKGDSFL